MSTWSNWKSHYREFRNANTGRAGVYCIRCETTGFVYIGQSANIAERIFTHITRLQSSTHKCKLLQIDYDEHQLQAFSFEVLEYCDEPFARSQLESKHTSETKREILYSDFELLNQEEKRKVYGAAITFDQAKIIRKIASRNPKHNCFAIAGYAYEKYGIIITGSSVWNIIHNKRYYDADYKVPESWKQQKETS
jgi:hypothetical protein